MYKRCSSHPLQYLETPAKHKLATLVAFLNAHRQDKVIVYFLTCAAVDFLRVVLPQLPRCKVRPVHSTP